MRWFQRAWVVSLVLAPAYLGCATGTDSKLEEARVRIHELQRENSELREKLEVLEARLDVVMDSAGIAGSMCPPSSPAIDASVLDVSRELKLVVLDKGKRDSVKPGYEFTVYKNSTYKGRIRIQDVQEDTSTGLILDEKNPITAGDSASTVL